MQMKLGSVSTSFIIWTFMSSSLTSIEMQLTDQGLWNYTIRTWEQSTGSEEKPQTSFWTSLLRRCLVCKLLRTLPTPKVFLKIKTEILWKKPKHNSLLCSIISNFSLPFHLIQGFPGSHLLISLSSSVRNSVMKWVKTSTGRAGRQLGGKLS